MIIDEMKALLDLFEAYMPDKETNRLLHSFCGEQSKWIKAHDLFTTIRRRNLKAIKEKHILEEGQYCFEEVCAKTLFNMTRPNAPFDQDSPYLVVKYALSLAQVAGIEITEVVNIVAPNNALQQTPKKVE